MNDKHKKKEDLIKELTALRRRIERFEKSGLRPHRSVTPKKPHDSNSSKVAPETVRNDTPDYKVVAAALRESEKRLRTLVDAIPDAVFFKDAAGRHIIANKANETLFGLSPEAMIGKTVEDLLPRELASVCRKNDEELLNGKKTIRSEEYYADEEGNTQVLDTIKVPLYDDNGAAIGLVGISRDVTGRKKAEEEIRRSEEFIRGILDTVDEGFIVIERDFRIMIANKAYCGQVGEPADRVIGRHCYEVSHRSSKPCYDSGEDCAVLHVFNTGRPHTALHKHKDAKGSILYVETKAYPLKDSSGDILSVIETVNNITEKHLLEEERLKTQKLEAIGTLAGGIAHDFNNLLQGIFGHISMAKITLTDKDRSLAMLEQAEQALHMSVNLTTQLLTFSKGGKPMKKKISLKSILGNSARFALSGSRADYRITIDDNLWAVEADEGQIGQVIQNIVLNADQAMPEGGTITITARNVLSSDERMFSLPRQGKYVEIAVRDSGIGIPEKYLQKIFDPYFTTKEKGSGLGLATSYSIIKNHGGAIDVNSELGKGTVFHVYLPAVEMVREIEEPKPASPFMRTGKILVMDDEEIVRMVAGQFLKSLNHEVDFADNGEAALMKYMEAKASGRPFDIVILDLTIRGGTGGSETIRKLREADPEVKAVVSSGYSDDVMVADYRKYGFVARLTKPYKIEELRDTLNALLAA